jgi:prepilin-type N-terminal cleavage/methylation domain-containing protein
MITRPKHTAFTLVELIVSLMVFAMLGTLVALMVRSYASSQLKTEMGTDVDRALSLTSGRLETLLRGCRVVLPAVGDTSVLLQFQAPQVSPEGLLVVTATGEPEWQPVQEISFQDGLLVVAGTTQTTVGNLGLTGDVTYERLTAGMLRVNLTATFEGSDSIARKSDTLSFDLSTVP